VVEVTTNFPTNASHNDWLRFDDVILQSTTPPPPPTPTPIPTPGNLLVNGGFESGMAGWQVWAGSRRVDSDAAYNEPNGHNSPTCRAHWKSVAFEVSTYQTLTVRTTDEHILSAWVKTRCGNATNFVIRNRTLNL